ncbi:MAG: VCBS repeat-containing protein [Terriglobales bacterium]
MKHATRSFLLASATLATITTVASAGQFKRVTYYGVGSRQQPYHVVASHLTNSGNVDLAVGDYLSDRVSILLGNGDGTFQKALTFPVPAPIGIAVGDFNEDGIQDVAVVETGGTADGAIAIFLGDGKGHFKLSASYALGVGSDQIAVADLNGDGHLDVAVTNFGFGGAQGSIMTFFGDGHGKLKDRKTYPLKGEPDGIAAGDLDGDSLPDIAVTQFTRGSVAVFMNDGTGKFLKPVSYNVGAGEVVDVKIADLRNNGDQDLVIANLSQGMVVLLNKGNGTFGKPAIYRPCAGKCSAGPEACTVADFNLDGKLDVACAAQAEDSYFFYGKGNGTFGTAIAIANTIKNQGGFSIAAGDFNNDNAPDLAIPIEEYGKVAILLNTQ